MLNLANFIGVSVYLRLYFSKPDIYGPGGSEKRTKNRQQLFLSDFVYKPIPLIVFDWSEYLFQCTFPINAEKESVSWDIPPRVAETLRYRVIYSTIYST